MPSSSLVEVEVEIEDGVEVKVWVILLFLGGWLAGVVWFDKS